MRRSLVPLLLVVLAGCPKDDAPQCTPDVEKAAVLQAAQQWYLYPELLPASVDLAAYASAADLLDALTATAQAQGKDRGWSFVTTAAAEQAFFTEGTTLGFGFGLLVRGDRLYVSQVFPASAAADAGFVRGDEILQIGDTPATLAPVAPLIAAGTLGSALGPTEAGVTRSFEVVPRSEPLSVVRTMSRRIYSLDPVPGWPGATLIDRPGTSPAGYVALRTFVSTADARLRQVFASFKAAGVTDVVVDLRYNGGGLLSTSEVLANLLGRSFAGVLMYSLHNNPSHVGSDELQAFAATPLAEAIAPARVAFVTTRASASASELVPNVLEPWLVTNVALVGDRTYGKPVGQRAFGIRGCDTLVFLVSFKLANAQGDADYFGGLPDVATPPAPPGFSGAFCPALDDLDHETSEQAEASTAAALDWLASGTCPPAPALALPRDEYPSAAAPSIAQAHIKGLF